MKNQPGTSGMSRREMLASAGLAATGWMTLNNAVGADNPGINVGDRGASIRITGFYGAESAMMMKTRATHNQFSLTRILAAVIVIALAQPVAPAASAADSKSAKSNLAPPPLPVLSPTALTGDAGDQRAYLRWNLQLEGQENDWENFHRACSIFL